jgi:hypothetical protein
MATIKDIERRDAEIWAAEARALRDLAKYLREAVIDLPVESGVARAFARRARTIEGAARHRDLALHGGGELQMLTRDIREQAPQHPIEVAKRSLLAAADLDDGDGSSEWASVLRRFAYTLPDRGGA